LIQLGVTSIKCAQRALQLRLIRSLPAGCGRVQAASRGPATAVVVPLSGYVAGRRCGTGMTATAPPPAGNFTSWPNGLQLHEHTTCSHVDKPKPLSGIDNNKQLTMLSAGQRIFTSHDMWNIKRATQVGQVRSSNCLFRHLVAVKVSHVPGWADMCLRWRSLHLPLQGRKGVVPHFVQLRLRKVACWLHSVRLHASHTMENDEARVSMTARWKRGLTS